MGNEISPSLDFILRALRFFVRPEAGGGADLVRKTKAVLQWDPLLNLARRHRVLPFLTLSLDRVGAFSEIPAEIRTVLEKDLQSAVLDNRAKMIEFRNYNRCFEEAGIPVIPLKGIGLTETVYKDTPVRRMSDVDLLIKKSDLPRADEVLQEQGFATPPLMNAWHTPLSEKIDGKGSRIRGHDNLDLQWGPRFMIGDEFAEAPLQGAWERAERRQALGTNVFLLSAVDHANYLLYQAANDYCKDYLFLYQLLDLAKVLQSGNLSPDCFERQSAAPSSRAILERLGKATEEIFFLPTADYSESTGVFCAYLIETPLRPNGKVFFMKIASLPYLCFWEKILMYLGYFIPDHRRLRQDYGEGGLAFLKGCMNHWGRFTARFFKYAAGIIK